MIFLPFFKESGSREINDSCVSKGLIMGSVEGELETASLFLRALIFMQETHA